MKSVKFNLDDHGQVTVLGDTVDLYRHLNFNADAHYLSDVAKKVAQELIPEEIEKLKLFDAIYGELKENIDLPDKDISLIATLLLDNNGKISVKKRKGVLQHIHSDSLDQAEKIRNDLFDNDESSTLN